MRTQYNEVKIILPDDEEFTVLASEAARMIENFDECLGNDGRFKINGTKYFYLEPTRTGTIDEIRRARDGGYRMLAYGGYEWGGRGCFYVHVNPDGTPDCAER